MMMSIADLIKAVENATVNKQPLPGSTAYDVVMYLEMLHDLMADTAHYYGAFVEANLGKRINSAEPD